MLLRLPIIKTFRGKLDFGKVSAVWHRFARYVRPHWGKLIGALLATFGAVAVHVASPWPIKLIFDVVLSHAMARTAIGKWFSQFSTGPGVTLAIICAAILLLAIIDATFCYLRDVLLAQTGQQVVGKIRHDLFRHLQRLGPDVFESHRTGDLLMRLTGDIQMLRQMIVNAWVTAGQNVLTIIAMVAMMFWLNPMLAAVVTAVIPLVVVAGTRTSKHIRHATKMQREKESFIASIASEVLSAITVVQAFNREKIEQQRLARQNRSSIRAGVRTTRLQAKLLRVVSLSSAAALCGVLYLGVSSVLAGDMTRGDLLVFVAYTRAVAKPLRKLSRLASQTAKATICGMRIMEIFKIPPAIQDRPDAIVAKDLHGDVVFDNVGFVYPDKTQALHGISVHVAAGQRVAIVGPSGAGKSTMMKLLLRFYDPAEGNVRFDGRDLREYTVASVRSQIAVVQQDSVLFGLTVAENIALGCETVDIDAVTAAAKEVGAHAFIDALPHGYETKLSERGTTLSGGQRQRIALARALLRKASLLILDEPVTGLDAQAALDAEQMWLHGVAVQTTIVICHDLSAMERFDRIVVLDNGSVVDAGSHAELMDRCDVYTGLHRASRLRATCLPITEEISDADESQRLAS